MKNNFLELGTFILPLDNLALFHEDMKSDGWDFYLKSPPGWRIFVSDKAVESHIGIEEWERLLEALFNGEEIGEDLFISTQMSEVHLPTEPGPPLFL